MRERIKHPVVNGVAKVPIIMQMEALECGAACLAMVTAYYDKWIPLGRVRLDCGVSRDGSNAKNILLAARSYGMNANGYRLEPDELRRDGKFPCIIHWNLNHFVVLNGFKKGKAIINDPAKGLLSVSMEEFDKAFTGICLFVEPGVNFQTEGKPRSVWSFARSRLRGTGMAGAFVVVATLISVIANILRPGFSRVFMDRLLTQQNPQWLIPFIITLGAISVIQVFSSAVQTIYSNKLNGKLAVMGNMTFLWKVLHLPMEFFSQRMAGDIQSRQNSNAVVAGSLMNTVAPLILNLAMVVFYLVVMVRYSLIMALIGVSSVLLNLFLTQIISQKRVNLSRVQMRDTAKLSSATVSGIEMIETIKACGSENGFFMRWSGYQASVNARAARFTKDNLFFVALPQFVSMLTSATVTMLGVYLVMEGHFTVGMLMAFQGFLNAFMTPAMSLLSAGQTITEMRSAMERIEDVMLYPDDLCFTTQSSAAGTEYEKLKGKVELKCVTFGYSALGEPLIRDFNMCVDTGGCVAIVGASGCGKSTIAHLIAGLYQPWSGEILFDGKPISHIDRNVFTGSLAVVDQEISLFEDTVADNIKLWDSSIENFEMILAARDAKLHDDIMHRQGGYRAMVSEGGKNFSGGQRQRLEIARVLAQDPSIIIMDEATSALDAKTEHEVVNAIRARGITCIVIAHRLSTIRDCDEIIVLDKGIVVERGTHDELIEQNVIYTSLIYGE